jgi:hypothetical protein
MPFWLAAVFGFLIVARSTRFINSDVLAKPIRLWADGIIAPGRFAGLRRLARRPLYAIFGDELSILVTCPWCLSIYFALPPAAVAVYGFGGFSTGGSILALAGLWLGYSYAYAILAQTVDAD